MGPLHGIRIIDMTSVLMGPSASQTLGDMGADVIKVETLEGDIMRQVGPMRHNGMGPIFLNANRSKRSIALNLKHPDGLKAILRLLQNADVLMYNVRRKAMNRLGLSYDSVKEVNSRIIYAGMFGFGQSGPYASRPAYDDLIQGASALPYLMGRASDGTPRYVPMSLADRVVGLAAANAILATLVARGRTGHGDQVDVPMFETMVSFVLGDHLGGLTFEPPLDDGGYARQLSPYKRPYRTKDGYLCVLVYNNDQWSRFLKSIGRESILLEDARFATYTNRLKNIDIVYKWLGEVFEQRTTSEWIKVLEGADIPFMPLHDFQSIMKDPQLQAVDYFQLVNHPSEGKIRSMRSAPKWRRNQPGDTMRLAPRLGEHTAEVLREVGFDDEEIGHMVAEGAALVAPTVND